MLPYTGVVAPSSLPCCAHAQDIRFVPLKQEREFNAAELMEFYKAVRNRVRLGSRWRVGGLRVASPAS